MARVQNKYVWTSLHHCETLDLSEACGGAFASRTGSKGWEAFMKKGIFIALAALAVAVLAIPEAEGGDDGRTFTVRIAGSNFSTSDADGVPTPVDGRPIVAIQNGIAKGGGASLFTSNAVLDAFPQNPADFPPACLAAGLGGTTVDISLVLMYEDGSLLSLATAPGSIVCASADATFFTVLGAGDVTGGEKRFAGATGTFTIVAETTPPRVTGELEIDLD